MKKIVEGVLTSKFGQRVHPVTGERRMHNGVDISAPAGTPVFCPAAGQVVARGTGPSEGNFVHVRSGAMTFVFMHLQSFSVVQGQPIFKGWRIGKVGKTGLATGYHLHFEVWVNGIAVNPEPYLTFN